MTGNLNIQQISEAQDDKEISINAATLKLDQAMTDWFDVDVTAGNVVLSTLEFEENIFFRVQNATVVGRTLTVPASKRLFAVESLATNTQDVDLVRGSTVITLIPGDTGTFYTDGTADGLIAVAGGGGVSTWLGLSDTPSAYTGQAGKVSAVNVGETAMELVNLSGGPTGYIAVQPLFRGALLNMAANQTGLSAATWTPLEWGTATYDTTLQPDDTGDPQKFWLGPDLTFTADNTTEQLTATAHAMNTGDGPFQLSNSGGGLPAGLVAATNYWCINISANVLQVATNRANAIAGTPVAFTTDGTGTHTLERATWLVIPADVSKIRLIGGFATSALTAGDDIGVRFAINEAVTHEGGASIGIQEGNLIGVASLSSPVLSVSEGDRIEIEAWISAATEDVLDDVRTFFSVEVVEESKPLSYPGITVYKPNIGCLLNHSTNEATAGGVPEQLPWDTEGYDTGYKGAPFHDTVTNNSRITIPDGITKVRLGFNLDWDTPSSGTVHCWVSINGVYTLTDASALGLPFTAHSAFSGSEGLSAISAVLDVASGDYFELTVQTSGTGQVDSSPRSYMWMEVVETDEDVFVPEQVEIFLIGVPAISNLVYQKVAMRRFSLADDLFGSQAYAITAPSGAATTFDVDRNGIKIGEISFADGVNTATFTTIAAAIEVFEIGDRLGIDSPANLNSLADISINLKAWRS